MSAAVAVIERGSQVIGGQMHPTYGRLRGAIVTTLSNVAIVVGCSHTMSSIGNLY
jgi:hypothetical protein